MKKPDVPEEKRPVPGPELPYWKAKSLWEMSRREWEDLCDGCGLCCLEKLEDEETGEVHYTSVACRWLDTEDCRCTVYRERKRRAPDCLMLSADSVRERYWLPATCAYRLLWEGKDLPPWHPLVSGDTETVHASGISVRRKVISEAYVDPKTLAAYIISTKL